MQRFWLLIFLLFAPVSSAFGITLLSNIREACEGDYLVAQQNRTCTLILVSQKQGDQAVLEEVTLPERMGRPKTIHWKNWLEKGAPRHTSWTAHVLDLKTGRVVGTYSYAQNSWMKASPTESLLSTLITLDFHEVPEAYRRRVGPPPPGGKDNRPYWQPALVYEGSRRREVIFKAFEGNWPQDRSELDGKRVTIYLPASEVAYPAHFPYWVEVSPLTLANKIRVIDSGRSLLSPKPKLLR
ncbi:MAG: hypothetical protein AB7F31_06520 [Parachlamydiales bacterium]